MRLLLLIASVATAIGLGACDGKDKRSAPATKAATASDDKQPASEPAPTETAPSAAAKPEPCAEMSCGGPDVDCINCGKSGFCVPSGTKCADICKTKRDEFEAVTRKQTACKSDEDCVIHIGNCEVGLGGCFAAVNKDGATRLATIRDEFAAADCNFKGSACRCAAPPASARCTKGVCVGSPP
jgi:hypothetical protein